MNKYIPKYLKKKFVVIFLARVFSIPKKLLHIIRNKIKKESWQLVLKNSYSMSKYVQKMDKKLKIFSFEIHKGARIWRKPKTYLNKGSKHKKNYMEGLNSKNKNIQGGGSP